MKTITIKNRYDEILYSHTCENNTYKITLEKAVKEKIDLTGAYLYDLYLSNINLSNIKLSGAYLNNITLNNSDLSDANLGFSHLTDIRINNSNLCCCNLTCSNLSQVNITNSCLNYGQLNDAYLLNINLHKSMLYKTNFSNSYLHKIKLDSAEIFWNTIGLSLACPEEGSFIGYKKVSDCLIKLEIPADAKRSSATSTKCRCDKAKVLEILNLKTNKTVNIITNEKHKLTNYEVGKIVYADSFDEDRWNECSHGIHFFIDKRNAINYYD
jgi:uncharacterized protein YjbI with pentapeptide repeats